MLLLTECELHCSVGAWPAKPSCSDRGRLAVATSRVVPDAPAALGAYNHPSVAYRPVSRRELIMTPWTQCRLALLASLAALLVGCGAHPTYPTPELDAPSARLWFAFESDQTGPKAVRFNHNPGPLKCGQPLDTSQTLAAISLGNPDIENIGENGLRVSARESLRVVATSVAAEPNPSCTAMASFGPKAKQEYRISFRQRGGACSLGVQVLNATSGRRKWPEEPSTKAVNCVAK
jgi:hypothetical protein